MLKPSTNERENLMYLGYLVVISMIFFLRLNEFLTKISPHQDQIKEAFNFL